MRTPHSFSIGLIELIIYLINQIFSPSKSMCCFAVPPFNNTEWSNPIKSEEQKRDQTKKHNVQQTMVTNLPKKIPDNYSI